jgi:hypothetical protein
LNKDNAPEYFLGEEALQLARQGKDAWNAWAEANPGREVSFEGVNFTLEGNNKISFAGFKFPGHANFSKTKFLDAKFGGAIFFGAASFSNATFEGEADFGGAIFKGYALFDGGTFNGPVLLGKSQFGIVPDFRRCEFKKHVTLHGMQIDFRSPTTEFEADMYRRLKEIAINARDHDREQIFFAYELMAKCGHETRGLKTWPSHLYQLFGDFGRSLLRPSGWLLGVWLGFGVLYNRIAVNDWSHIWDGLLFSTAQLFPFLGASKGALADAGKALFGGPPFSGWVNALGMLEGVLGILFLFLIGLALRNRFRI